MKRLLSTFCISSLVALSSSAQSLTPEEFKALANVQSNQTIRFAESDSINLRTAKATKCVPTARQLVWQQLEFTCFIHFGINTFTGREWGNGKETPTKFNPSKVDTDQWCATAKAAGMRMMMITVKHHDGFCTWQTKYNNQFSVKASPWKKGQGDVLRQLSNSCKKYDLKLGVYLSPADLYQIENKEGLYGNLSPYQDSVIPTSPADFQSNPTKGRNAPDGKPTFKYKVDDYNRYMLNQLYELLTEYGDIHEVWFDGAHPKRKGGQQYTRSYWTELIRTLAPHAVIAIKGPDARWCGNERGGTRSSEWSSVAIAGDPKDWTMGDMKARDLGSRKKLISAGFVQWYPCEVDVSIRHGWFWRNPQQKLRTLDHLYDIYERSVGGNAVFLLNVPPNRDGVFDAPDTKILKALGQRINATYGKSATQLTRANDVYTFDQSTVINRCVIMEDIATSGQRVETHALDAWVDGKWLEIAKAQTIGYKKILRFSEITTHKIRLRILDQRLTAKISHVSVHLDIAPLKAPEISRNLNGLVSIKGNGKIYYTLDQSAPTANSPEYNTPIPMAKGGVIKAVATRDGTRSDVITIRFDITKKKWKIHHVSSHNPSSGEGSEKSIDGNPNTHWHSKWKGGYDKMPHSLTIDFGENLDLKGFTYLPRKSGQGGVVDQYHLELSRDGKVWRKASEGRFDNIQNNPTQREIIFTRTYSGIRYLRFTSVHSVGNKPQSSAAEIGVVTKSLGNE